MALNFEADRRRKRNYYYKIKYVISVEFDHYEVLNACKKELGATAIQSLYLMRFG